MAKASYTVKNGLHGIYVVDRNEDDMSVTNDAEAVVDEVTGMYGTSKRIFYRDSGNNWDELVFDQHGFVGFKFGVSAEAKVEIKALYNNVAELENKS